MKLNLYILADELVQYNPLVLSENTHTLDICAIDEIDSNKTDYSANTLYICSAEQFQAFTAFTSDIYLLVIDNNTNVNFNLVNKSANILYLPDVSPKDKFKLYSEIYKIQQKYNSWYERMLNVIIKRGSLQSLIEIAAEILNNPLLLEDFYGRTMAECGADMVPENNELWHHYVLDGYLSLDDYKKLCSFASDNDKFLFTNSYIYTGPENKFRYMGTNVRLSTSIVALFNMLEVNKFTHGQFALMDYVAATISKYLENTDNILQTINFSNMFLSQLANGVRLTETEVQAQLARIKWDSKGVFKVITFMPSAESSRSNMMLNFIISELASLFPFGILFQSKGCLSFVLNSKFNPFNEELLSIIRTFTVQKNFVTGISMEFYDFILFKKYYEQSIKCLNFLESDTKSIMCSFSDITQTVIQKYLVDSTDALDIVHPRIELLFRQDYSSDKQLVHSLYNYILSGYNKSLTAKRLFIHRNTLINQLLRISEICGVDFSDELSESETLHYLLSCYIILHLSRT